VKVFVVDPSLYTAPYDEHFVEGLVAAEVEPILFSRPLRNGEQLRLPTNSVRNFFYKLTDRGPALTGGWGAAAKGLEHLIDQRRFIRTVRRELPDVVHFQWSVLPFFDVGLFHQIRRYCPVVFTMHDTTPFNGAETSKLQTFGFDKIYRAASRVIVHTQSASETLRARGLDQKLISIIPHGPLTLKNTIISTTDPHRDDRWTFVAFGRVRAYKGLDVLIDAISRLPETVRQKMRCIIAGEEMMDVRPLRAQIAASNLQDCVELRLWQHSESEVSVLLAESDCFVFPYLAIEASGVLHLVSDLRRWMIASDLGAFGEVIIPGETGELAPAGNAAALSEALARAIETRPKPISSGRPMTSWSQIGRETVAVYEALLSARNRVAEEGAAEEGAVAPGRANELEA
jgi:glycosyltransferase involved in cell wall biosynthesis